MEPTRSAAPTAWRLYRGVARDPGDDRAPIDDVLVVRMPGPRSYTGEDVVEIHCHGSPLVVERLLAACVRTGARSAERGEFTRRAVLNGRLDLLQAEAVADLIDARVGRAAAAAWNQLQGALSKRLQRLRSRVLDVLADVEANVDFSDDDLPEENVDDRVVRLDGVRADIAAMLAGFAASRRLREGCRIVFTGRPNVGKSSLVNALLGFARMIVTDEPGTTRDAVEEVVDVAGIACVLIDTAGVRETPSRAERAAVERARAEAGDADIVVAVIDRSQPLDDEDRRLLGSVIGRDAVVVLNKSDLPDRCGRRDVDRLAASNGKIVEASAVVEGGCDALATALVALAGHEAAGESEPVGISRIRHRTALENADRCLAAARQLAADRAPELVAFELRAALSHLASITDPVDNEAVLDRIFAQFCVGK